MNDRKKMCKQVVLHKVKNFRKISFLTAIKINEHTLQNLKIQLTEKNVPGYINVLKYFVTFTFFVRFFKWEESYTNYLSYCSEFSKCCCLLHIPPSSLWLVQRVGFTKFASSLPLTSPWLKNVVFTLYETSRRASARACCCCTLSCPTQVDQTSLLLWKFKGERKGL